MKKVIVPIAFMVISAFALSSCQKDYTCTCTVTTTILGQTTSTSASTTINDKKSDAEDACNQGDSSFTDPITGASVVSACEID